MCESYRLRCECGRKSAELFFGKMLLGRSAVIRLFCPECEHTACGEADGRVEDNGWALDLDMSVIRHHSSTLGVSPQEVTADWIFDNDYVTWVGITPDDSERRNREREEILALARTDLKGYLVAMKQWGIDRQNRFSAEGWRKALR